MPVASALFFETREQIFLRVFEALRPRTDTPQFQVRFRPFVNPNSRIKRLADGRIEVELTDVLEDAPAAVVESLAWVLLAKLYRKPVPANELAHYRRYLHRKDMRARIEQVRQERGRKQVAAPEGNHYNLEAMFDELNFAYFHGLMSRPAIGWSRRVSRTVLGHYDPSHHTIVLSRLLDSTDVPRVVVEYVLFHEMLHIKYPTEHRNGRRCVHTAEFKAAERTFAGYKEAVAAIKKMVSGAAGAGADHQGL